MLDPAQRCAGFLHSRIILKTITKNICRIFAYKGVVTLKNIPMRRITGPKGRFQSNFGSIGALTEELKFDIIN